MTDSAWGRVARIIEADALEDLRGHKKLQSPEGQQFLESLKDFHTEQTDPLMPWLAREFRKGRLQMTDPIMGSELFHDNGTYTEPLTRGQVSHWADWYHSPHRRKVPLEQLQIGHMADEIAAWEKQMADKATAEEYMPHAQEGEVVHQYPDGWNIRKLPPSALPFEGWAMRGKPDPHTGAEAPICVGEPQYQEGVGKGRTMIYSLRDPEHMPHVTWQMNPTQHAPKPEFDPVTYLNKLRQDEGFRPQWVDHPDALDRDFRRYNNYLNSVHQDPGQVQPGQDPDLGLANNLSQIRELHRRLRADYDYHPGEPLPQNSEIVQIQGKGNSMPKPEYQARLKQWFETFPENERPRWEDQDPIDDIDDLINPELPGMHADDGYGPHGDYGVNATKELDYPRLLAAMGEHGSGLANPFEGHYEPSHGEALYQGALQRKQIPQLAEALSNYQDEVANPEWDDLEENNFEYHGGYPGESYDEDPERWDQQAEANVGNQPWHEEPATGKEAFDAAKWQYDDAINELRRNHPPSQLVDDMYQRLEPHRDPAAFAPGPPGPDFRPGGYGGYYNEPPPQQPLQPTMARVASYDPILDTPRDVYEDAAYNKPGYDELSDDERSKLYWETAGRRKAWDHAVRHAISMGHMTPEDARARGYYPHSHEVGDNSWAEFNHGWKPLPEELYHVTTNVPGVLQHGLKTRSELGQDRGMGLGAGDDDTVSYTDDPAVAQNIYDTMREAHSVARGEFTPHDMIEHARQGVGAPRPWLKDLWSYWNHEGEEPPPGVRDLLNGIRRYNNWSEANTAEGWAAKGFTPDERSISWMGGDGQMRYSQPTGPRTEEDQREANFDFYKTWLAYRDHAGGPSNPLIMSSDVHGLAKLDPRDIGILQMTPKPGALGYQLSALGEWRTPTGQAVDVKNVLTDSNTEPQTGQAPMPPRITMRVASRLAHPLYTRWVYSPATKEVAIEDNNGDPLDVKYHGDMAREINEPNLVHGYATRIDNGWRLTDWESDPITDHNVIAQVMRKLQGSEATPDNPQEDAWTPAGGEDWDRIHSGMPT